MMDDVIGASILMTADDGTLDMFAPEDREAILEYRKLFEIDYYYPQIESFTFETRFVEFNLLEGKVWRDFNRGAMLDDQQARTLSLLKERIDEEIQYFTRQGKSVFVRLSSRSPKDAVDKDLKRIVPLYRSEIDRFEDPGNSEKLIAIRRAFFQSMKVNTVEEAFDLIMYSSRTISDMKRAIDYSDTVDWKMKFVIREFVDMPIEYELRGFVCNSNFTALSQYYCDCYFPQIEENEEFLVESMTECFNQVTELVPVDSYIIDFVWIPGTGIKIIELNPFSKTTGSGLFDWETDKEIIENGPFEFRYIKEPINENVIKGTLVPWQTILNATDGDIYNMTPSKCLLS